MKQILAALFVFTLCVQSVHAQDAPLTAPRWQGDDDTLKILSWNIYMLPPLVYFTGKMKRARALVDQLKDSDYDIIVFQEAFNAFPRGILKRGLKDTYPYRIGPANRAIFPKASSGIWILSRLPIRELGTVKYSQSHGFDNRMSKKGALMVEFEWQSQTMQLAGTHLNAGGPFAVRESQMVEMTALLDAHHRPGVPQLICGDMNTNRAEPQYYNKMLEIFRADDPQPYGGVKWTSDGKHNDLNWSSTGQQKVIDYFMFRKNGLGALQYDVDVRQITQRWSDKHKDLADHNSCEARIWLNR